jgi:FdhE protein
MRSTDTLTAPIPIGLEATPPLVRLPELQAVFSRRAERCRQLARGHPLEPYLLFIAELAAAQDAALNSPLAGPPRPDGLAGAGTAEVPLLHRLGWHRDDA